MLKKMGDISRLSVVSNVYDSAFEDSNLSLYYSFNATNDKTIEAEPIDQSTTIEAYESPIDLKTTIKKQIPMSTPSGIPKKVLETLKGFSSTPMRESSNYLDDLGVRPLEKSYNDQQMNDLTEKEFVENAEINRVNMLYDESELCFPEKPVSDNAEEIEEKENICRDSSNEKYTSKEQRNHNLNADRKIVLGEIYENLCCLSIKDEINEIIEIKVDSERNITKENCEILEDKPNTCEIETNVEEIILSDPPTSKETKKDVDISLALQISHDDVKETVETKRGSSEIGTQKNCEFSMAVEEPTSFQRNDKKIESSPNIKLKPILKNHNERGVLLEKDNSILKGYLHSSFAQSKCDSCCKSLTNSENSKEGNHLVGDRSLNLCEKISTSKYGQDESKSPKITAKPLYIKKSLLKNPANTNLKIKNTRRTIGTNLSTLPSDAVARPPDAPKGLTWQSEIRKVCREIRLAEKMQNIESAKDCEILKNDTVQKSSEHRPLSKVKQEGSMAQPSKNVSRKSLSSDVRRTNVFVDPRKSRTNDTTSRQIVKNNLNNHVAIEKSVSTNAKSGTINTIKPIRNINLIGTVENASNKTSYTRKSARQTLVPAANRYPIISEKAVVKEIKIDKKDFLTNKTRVISTKTTLNSPKFGDAKKKLLRKTINPVNNQIFSKEIMGDKTKLKLAEHKESVVSNLQLRNVEEKTNKIIQHKSIEQKVEKIIQNKPILSKSSATKDQNKCKYCDKKFVLKQALENHFRYNCEKIPSSALKKITSSKNDSKPNVETKARKSIIPVSTSATKPINTSNASQYSAGKWKLPHSGVYRTPNKAIVCYSCKKNFTNILDFTQHMLSHSPSNVED